MHEDKVGKGRERDYGRRGTVDSILNKIEMK